MKKLNILLLKKRFYLFGIILLIVFVMNILFWNETTRFIRILPNLFALQSKSDEDVYEVRHNPRSEALNESGGARAYSYSAEEQQEILSFLTTFFLHSNSEMSVYTGKSTYLDVSSGKKERLTEKTLQKELFYADEVGFVDGNFIDKLIVFNPSKEDFKKLEEFSKKKNVDLRLFSLKDLLKEEFQYYFGNFLWALAMTILFYLFVITLSYFLIASAIKIFKQEIRLFRVIGVSKKAIQRNFSYLLISPVFVAAIVSLFCIHAVGYGILLVDYLYLFALNFILAGFIYLIIRRKLKGVLND
ncbi:hypothetical protein SAMN02745116_01810 [Pilibacter termitis]|uniref:Bacteriocin-associated integral membrane (Putative immunity) protein n=1 Tax=Pilibacter termitis TaxID=263852 RepID=A0A1T4PIL8_9ENTE|nr:hypothetical protein [Pilibacter termitis]SJZ91393.1 hypothetical protein SAMN02745116_01810 [Pilibacter termitis]